MGMGLEWITWRWGHGNGTVVDNMEMGMGLEWITWRWGYGNGTGVDNLLFCCPAVSEPDPLSGGEIPYSGHRRGDGVWQDHTGQKFFIADFCDALLKDGAS